MCEDRHQFHDIPRGVPSLDVLQPIRGWPYDTSCVHRTAYYADHYDNDADQSNTVNGVTCDVRYDTLFGQKISNNTAAVVARQNRIFYENKFCVDNAGLLM